LHYKFQLVQHQTQIALLLRKPLLDLHQQQIRILHQVLDRIRQVLLFRTQIIRRHHHVSKSFNQKTDCLAAEPTCSSEATPPLNPNIDTPPPPPSLNQDKPIAPPAEPTCTSTPDAPPPPPPPPPRKLLSDDHSKLTFLAPPPPVQPNIDDPTLSYGKQPTYGSGQTPYDQLPLCVDVDTTKFTPHNVTKQEYAKIAGGSSTGTMTSTASITGMDGLSTSSATGTETSTAAQGVPEPLQGQSGNTSGASSITVHAFSALTGIVTAWFFALQ
jgi:hypothetical protein